MPPYSHSYSLSPDCPEPALKRFAHLSGGTLSDTARAALFRLCDSVRHYRAGSQPTAEGQAHPVPRVLMTGWACRQRLLSDGRRQIFTLYLPGDLILPKPAPIRPSILALTAVTLADIPVEEQAHFDLRYDALAAEEEQMMLDQIMRLGRQTAYERMAHLMLELRRRLAEVDMVDGDSFPLPLTQEMMADLLGLSIVHVNRTLQQMRRERLIELKGGRVYLQDAEQLAFISDVSLKR